jgi:carboxypeptidase C (cathepsin A)
MLRSAAILLFALVVGWSGVSVAASETAAKPADSEKEEKSAKSSGQQAELDRISTGTVAISGQEIAYEAVTGTLSLLNDKDEPTARVFSVYYRRTDGVDETARVARPLVFCFNGGPGSSSVWLHLGGLGPRRVVMPADGTAPPRPPFALETNPDCLLDHADLVFVDPVGTGFSRAEQGKDPKQFHGFSEDIGYLADYIRRFVGDHGRWASPKFLLGESYGALRVAGLADQLQERYGLYVNGVVLLSGLLDFRTLSTAGGNDLPRLCFLPAYAATAHYHKRLKPTPPLEQLLQDTRKFAFGDYASALLAGNRLDPDARSATAKQLGKFTGLDPQIWLDANLRLEPAVFRKFLLRDQGLVAGRFDSRVTTWDTDKISPYAQADPSFDFAWGAFATTINDYLRRDLKASAPQVYEVLGGGVNHWNYGSGNSFARADNRLVSALQSNPHLKVLVQCGHYDLATPPDSILHSIEQLDLPPELRRNLAVEYYPAGHMFYLHRGASAKMRADLAAFFDQK